MEYVFGVVVVADTLMHGINALSISTSEDATGEWEFMQGDGQYCRFDQVLSTCYSIC
jgi:hypothetical protein